MDLRDRCTIVTGGAGFIGSVLVGHLAAAGRRVAVVDELGADSRWRNLAGVPLSGYWDRGKFPAALLAGKVYPRPEAIVHLGACSATTETDAGYLMANNFDYTRVLAAWCLQHGVRFVYASSAATYGSGAQGFDDGEERLASLQPLNAYALSKHCFDLWALQAGAFHGPGAITGLKYFNIYGPNERHKGAMASMVLHAFDQIQESGKVRLFKSYRGGVGDGEQTRDFLYVEDAVAITAWFLDHPEAAGIYNVGSGTGRTWNDLAGAVFAALGQEPQIEYTEMPQAIRGTYQYATRAELGRLRASGCPVPQRTLEEGVRTYVQSHLLPAARAWCP